MPHGACGPLGKVDNSKIITQKQKRQFSLRQPSTNNGFAVFVFSHIK